MNNFILVQILGLITLILFVISLQQRKKETFLLLQTCGTIFFIAQYILAGRITGATVFTIVAVRGLVFFYYKKKDLKPSKMVLIAFQAILSIAVFLTWQNILSVLPLVATVAKTWGTWQDNMKWIRLTSVISQSSMIIYNFTASMYTGALTEICNLTSTLIAIWRYDFRKKSLKNL